MSCLVKSRRPNGTVYVYRSTSVWDPDKGYPVPKRTLVGKLDPTSGELIPTRKQNRKKGSADAQEQAAKHIVPEETALPSAQNPTDTQSAQDTEVWREYQETIDRLQRELDVARRENAKMRKLIQSMRKLLDSAGDIGGEPEA